MSATYWLISAASLIAVVLNIRRHVACFVIWAGTNLAWAGIDLAHGIVPQAVLQLVYFGLSIHGLCRWSNLEVNHGTARPNASTYQDS